MTTKEKLEMLAKPSWSAKDIQAYFDVCKNKSYDIFNKAKNKFNGVVCVGVTNANTDSVLRCFGSSRMTEIEIIKKILECKGETYETKNYY